ncbi:hypothetical protein ACIOHR_37620 [Streptomyces anulatus]
MDIAPLCTPHFRSVPGEVRRTDADMSDDSWRLRAVTAELARELLPGEPTSPALVSSADGAIDSLLLTIPSYAVLPPDQGDNPYAVVYADLLHKLPKDIALVVLTHDSVGEEVARWAEAAARTAPVTVVCTDDYLGFSIWAEDGYVVVEQPDKSRAFVEPAAFPRYADALVADRVKEAAGMGLFQAPLHFQGGNMLIGDDFFLIGIDYPALTFAEGILTAPPGASQADLISQVYARYLDSERSFEAIGSNLPIPAEKVTEFQLDGETWKQSLYAGNRRGTRQPIFHIDMFISLAGRGSDGRYRLLVGDPREAAQLTGETLQAHAMADVFDDIARQLSEHGYDVGRAPLPLVYADDPTERMRSWYFATSSNALVHRPSSGRPTVLLPTYGHGPYHALEATDQRHKQIWQDLGYDVIQLGDFHPFAINLGAAHCIKKYLGRS